jgi:hypothetical protein
VEAVQEQLACTLLIARLVVLLRRHRRSLLTKNTELRARSNRCSSVGCDNETDGHFETDTLPFDSDASGSAGGSGGLAREWSCARCTFLNPSAECLVCAMCDALNETPQDTGSAQQLEQQRQQQRSEECLTI